MNLTEPQAGSDLAAVRTRAVPQPRRHATGSRQKIFITYGEHDYTDNIIHLVLARTPDAPEGVKGISLFIVPKFLVNDDGTLGERNDVRCVSIEHKLGIHASPTCVMAYGDKERRGRLPGRRGEPRARVHVHHDEPRALLRRHGRRGHRRARVSARRRLRARSRAGQGGRAATRRAKAEPDHRASRHPPHADDDARATPRRCVPSRTSPRRRWTTRAAIRTRRAASSTRRSSIS